MSIRRPRNASDFALIAIWLMLVVGSLYLGINAIMACGWSSLFLGRATVWAWLFGMCG